MSVGLRRESEDPVGDLVHDRDPAVPGHRDHAVAEVPDEVAVEAVRDTAGPLPSAAFPADSATARTRVEPQPEVFGSA